MPDWSRHPNLPVDQAINEVYTRAGLVQNADKGIVPLFELIDAFSLTVVELENLSYRSTADYLRQETGRNLPLPQTQDRDLAGYLFATQYQGQLWGYIFLRKDDPLTRRRFSAAHELGHFMLHFLPLLAESSAESENLVLVEGITASETEEEAADGEITLTTLTGQPPTLQPPKTASQMEREADNFAAELLMPVEVCRRLVADYTTRIVNKREVLEKRLAAELMVSRQAISHRFRDLNLSEAVLVEPTAATIRSN